jgi:hypothetical protein
MSPIKEPHFFSHDLGITAPFPVRDEHRYLRLFRNGSGHKAIGEASSTYLRCWTVVPDRIKRMVPEARIIVLLRDPMERAYSHYLMHYRQRIEHKETLYEALTESPLAAIYRQTYAPAIRAYREAFGEGNVRVLMFEELKRSPHDVVVEVARFLEIDRVPVTSIDFSLENPGGRARGAWARMIFAARRRVPVQRLPLTRGWRRFLLGLLLAPPPDIDPRAVDLLRPAFETDLDDLEQLLGRPLPDLRRAW